MKKYNQPITHFIALGTGSLCQTFDMLAASIVEGDPDAGLTPGRTPGGAKVI